MSFEEFHGSVPLLKKWGVKIKNEKEVFKKMDVENVG